jgi:type II secretory pathway component PulM
MILIEAANNFGDNSQEGASAGPMALAVIALLGVITVLLWRNMNARIKRLPASFPDQRPAAQKAQAQPEAQRAEKAGTTATDASETPPSTDSGKS